MTVNGAAINTGVHITNSTGITVSPQHSMMSSYLDHCYVCMLCACWVLLLCTGNHAAAPALMSGSTMLRPTSTTRAMTLVPASADDAAAAAPSTGAAAPGGATMAVCVLDGGSSSADRSDCVMCMSKLSTARRSLHCSAARSSLRDLAVCSETCSTGGGKCCNERENCNGNFARVCVSS